MVPQLSKTYPGMEIEDAYEVQRLWAEGRTAKGAGVVGHKIGLTSRAMQKASKMTEADYGRILDDAFFHDGAQIDAGIFIKPRLEVELAFVMGTDLEGRGCQIHDVMRATEFVVPALEIIDYRTEVPPAIVDTIADNAAFGAIVTGGRIVRPFDVDIRWIGATLSQNGVIEESGVSAAVMGHPRLVGVETMCRRQRKHDCPIAKIHWSLLVARSIADPCAIREGAWQQWLRRPQMIRGFVSDNGRLQRVEGVMDRLDQVLWMDLLNPTKEEEADLERRLGINIPTREEMEEIEISSRLYQEDGAAFMTATLPAQVDLAEPRIAPVTFVLAGERLITVRYHEPRAFQTFPARAEKVPMGCGNGEAVLIALLEAVVDRLADILERAGRDIDRISRVVFQLGDTKPTKSRDFQKVLEEIGRNGDLTSNIRDSLATLERLIGYLGPVMTQRRSVEELRERIKTLSHDVRSLSDHSSFLSQKITFLLDATLGMINIEQNAIIKIFSVAAVVFLPPTLIASIYGMNFETMPELEWLLGYPFAIGLMILSAILPYLYFKRRGWL